MRLFRIETEHGITYENIDSMHANLLDAKVNVDYHNKPQLIRLHKITFEGSYEEILWDSLEENEILEVLKAVNKDMLSSIIEFYEYSYDENESSSRNERELAELIYEREQE